MEEQYSSDSVSYYSKEAAKRALKALINDLKKESENMNTYSVDDFNGFLKGIEKALELASRHLKSW